MGKLKTILISKLRIFLLECNPLQKIGCNFLLNTTLHVFSFGKEKEGKKRMFYLLIFFYRRFTTTLSSHLN